MADRIEILAVQDGDGNHDFTVFINGAPAQEGRQYRIEHVDPGAGGSRAEYQQLADTPDPARSPAFDEAVRQAYADSADSAYLDDDTDEEYYG